LKNEAGQKLRGKPVPPGQCSPSYLGGMLGASPSYLQSPGTVSGGIYL